MLDKSSLLISTVLIIILPKEEQVPLFNVKLCTQNITVVISLNQNNENHRFNSLKLMITIELLKKKMIDYNNLQESTPCLKNDWPNELWCPAQKR